MSNTKTKSNKSDNVEIEFVTEKSGVAEYRLKNGLKVLLVENHTAPVITLLVLYKVGSRNEAVGYTGATHFLEHMLFKGTKEHNPDHGNGIDDLLTQIGAYWNATTWFDRTSYYEVVPNEYLELCIKLEADRMRNLLLRQEDHDSEMSVVRNELERGENFPEDALEKELYAVAFREHPYHHPTIGWRSDVEGVPMDRLREFYNTFYWPDNASVILVGDFEPEAALKLMHKYYGQIPSAPKALPEVYTVEPPQEGERRLEINRVGDLPRVWFGYHTPEAAHEDTYALAALRHILGSAYERSSRLYKALIDKSLASDAFARHDDLRDPALFIVGATLNPDVEVKTVETSLFEVLEELAKVPVTKEELDRAKSANRKGTILSKADPSSLAFMLGEAESKADWHWLIEYDDKFDKVTAEDVMRVVKKYFVKENRTVGIFIPKDDSPTLANFEEDASDDVSGDFEDEHPEHEHEHEEDAVAPAVGQGKVDSGEDLKKLLALRPPAVKVERGELRKWTFAEKTIKKVLPNGLTLLFIRNPSTDSVGITAIAKAGKYFTHKTNGSIAEVVADLLTKGTENYSKLQIAEELENMGIPGSLEFSADNFRASFGTHVVVEDLPLFMKLLADVLRRPIFLEDELAKTKIEWQARYTEAINNTKMQAWNRLKRSIYEPTHPFYEKTFEEQLNELLSLESDTLRNVHARLYSPKSTTLVIVGDTELEPTLELVTKYFGDWKGEEAESIVIPQAPLLAKKRIEINLADKKSTDVVIAHPSTLLRNAPDFYAAKLANAALGQDTITSRLGNVVRDRAGLTYGIHSSFSDTAFGSAAWSISFSVNPLNVDRAIRLVTEVVNDYMENGISDDELNKESGRAVGSFTVGLASSLGISRALAEFEFLGLGVSALDQVVANYAATTQDQVNAAMKKYFKPSSAVTVIAGTLAG
ncbi:MAG TPA: pitrilysin family protein [Oculatellaceae cyanobacterium]